jgi:hypothetical protein
MDSKHTIELIGSAFEVAGVAVLVIGTVLAFARYIVSLIRFRDGPGSVYVSTRANRQIRTSCEIDLPYTLQTGATIVAYHVRAAFRTLESTT